MELILFIIYVYLGASANSYFKHNVLKVETVAVFNMQNFIMEKIIMGALLGWISIPVVVIMKLLGIGKN